jgi:hypothetical protein
VQVQLDAKTVSLQLGNQGVDVRITDNRGRQVGTLRIGHASVAWRKGKIGPSTGRKLELSKFITEHLDVLGAATPSAGRVAAAGPKRPGGPAKPSTGRATAARRKRPEAATKPSAGRAATIQRKRPVTVAKPSSPRATATGRRPGSRNPSSRSKTRR